eukprot:TRINITY_DN29433_c0_g2_i1.p1 TRINITY_DN29433_c0_g2~~TRINITY_DN29433_c0_g2_i1.p1  ORF type:complete len:734 (-),score=116.68 TRINITY_DN29433_c0_g2_i1:48-2249(-)
MGCPEATCRCDEHGGADDAEGDDVTAVPSEDIPLLSCDSESDTPRSPVVDNEVAPGCGDGTIDDNAPKLKRLPVPRQRSTRRTSSKQRKADKAADFALCPICCGSLGKSQEAIGALTHKRKRIEPDLYHLRCVSQMLCHSGSGQVGSSGDQQVHITWGTSPVTRLPVDGFLHMPPMQETERWVRFVDWREDGHVSVEGFAAAASALFPIGHHAIERFVRTKFQLEVGDSIESERLQAEVLPAVDAHCNQQARGQDNIFSLCSNVHTVRVKDLCRSLDYSRDCKTVGDSRFVAFASELGEIAEKGDMDVVNAAVQLFEHPEESVRRNAVALLSRVAELADSRVFDVLSASLNHSGAEVREAAIHALEQIARSSEREALELVAPRLKDDNACVRAAAIMATAQLGWCGNIEVIHSILPALKDVDAAVRQAVFQALAKIAPKGQSAVIDALVATIQSKDSAMVRRAAVVALGKVAEKGDRKSFHAVAELLGDKDAKVRRAAARTMAVLGAKEDPEALEAFLVAYKDKDSGVRKVVAESFPFLVEKGDPIAVRTACSWLKGETCADVRYGTLKTISMISERGDRRSIKAVISQFDESDPYLRWKAITELKNIAEVGDQRSIKAVGRHLQETNCTVRAAAAEVLGELAHCKDARAIWNVSQYLTDCDPTVKRCVEGALEKIKMRDPPRNVPFMACKACVPWWRRTLSDAPEMVTVVCSSTGTVSNVQVALPYDHEVDR